MKDNKVYLQDILDAVYRIEAWTQDSEFEDFEDDKGLLQSSVIRQLEIIGETANRLDADFTCRYPQIPWAKIVGMRNRLIHEYNTVDLDLTWQVVKHEIPLLGRQLEGILADFAKIAL